jgi:hypothetical protein
MAKLTNHQASSLSDFSLPNLARRRAAESWGASPSPMTTDQEKAVTRDDVQDMTRAINGLSRRLDDVKREFERRRGATSPGGRGTSNQH